MGDIKVNSRERVYDFPEMEIEGAGTSIMLVVPASALPEHTPSILMTLYESARAVEQGGGMLSFILRIIDDDGHIIKETQRLPIPRVEHKKFDQISDNYGFGMECRTSEPKICYDVRGVRELVFDIMEEARSANDAKAIQSPVTSVVTSPLEFPKEVMDDLNGLSASEQAVARENYGLLTILFKTGALKIDTDKAPPGGLLVVELPDGATRYPSTIYGTAIGTLGTKLLNALSASTPCEEVYRLNRLLMTVQDKNGGTKLLNDAKRFIKGSLVFQMAEMSGECTIDAANNGLGVLYESCGDDKPCSQSIVDGLALYEGDAPKAPTPEGVIGVPSAYYDIMLELSKTDRNAAMESVRTALEYAKEGTPLAYHRYLTGMNVTMPEAFRAILKVGERRHSVGDDFITFFGPVFKNFKGLGPREKMNELSILREDLIRFAKGDGSVERWAIITPFMLGLYDALEGDAPAKDYLSEAIINSLCAIDKDGYNNIFKGPSGSALFLLFTALLGARSGEYLQNNPWQTARLFKWVAELTNVNGVIKVNDDTLLMALLWNQLGQDDKAALAAVAATSVAEQILCVYLNLASFNFFDQERKLGIGTGSPINPFPDWEKMLGPEGMAAVAIAIANNKRSKDALAVTLLPVIEAAMNDFDSQDDRLYFVKRLMKEAGQPHIIAALVLNCFKKLDNETWRWTGSERLELVRMISKVLDERASFLEDVPIAGPLADGWYSRHVRHLFKALAKDDIEGLLQWTLRQREIPPFKRSFLTEIPMTVIPMAAVDEDGKTMRPIRLDYDSNPASLTRVGDSFSTRAWAQFPNTWNFWLDIPPTERSFAGAVKASYRLLNRPDTSPRNIMFLLTFINRPCNVIFYDDVLLGDFLEEKIIDSLKKLDKDENLAAWTVYASALIRQMPLERRLRMFKAISADYAATAKKASGGLPLGPISNVMGQAALGMNSLEELQIALPIINLVSNKLNVDIPGDDAGFNGIITGMANVIGMLDEERQLYIIGKVFDECMTALRGDTLKLFDRLFEPKDGETAHAGDFARRVGMRLARSKATNYAHLFLGAYTGAEVIPCEKRFDHAQEMALGATQAFMGKDATMTERDLQRTVFTVSNNIFFEGPPTPEFVVDRFSSWIAGLGEVGSSGLLFTGIRPFIQLIQSDGLPTPRPGIIQRHLEIAVPNLAKIVEAILKSDKLTPENRAALAGRLKTAASTCIAEKWETTIEPQETTLVEQCKLIKDTCN